MSCCHRRRCCKPCCAPAAVPVPVPIRTGGCGGGLPLIFLLLIAFLFIGNNGDAGVNTNIININSDGYDDPGDPDCCCQRKCGC